MTIIWGEGMFLDKNIIFCEFILSIHTSGNIDMHWMIVKNQKWSWHLWCSCSIYREEWNRPNPWFNNAMDVIVNDVLHIRLCHHRRWWRTYFILLLQWLYTDFLGAFLEPTLAMVNVGPGFFRDESTNVSGRSTSKVSNKSWEWDDIVLVIYH